MQSKLRILYEKNKHLEGILYLLIKMKFIFSKKYKTIKKEIFAAMEKYDNFRKNSKKIKNKFHKILVAYYLYHISAEEYYLYNFETIPVLERKKIMLKYSLFSYFNIINNIKYNKILNSKVLTYQTFKDFYKRDMIWICEDNESEKKKFYDFIKNRDAIFITSLSKKYHKVLTLKDYDDNDKLFQFILELKPIVIEDVIKQDNTMSKICNEIINTVNITTFRYHDDIGILWAYLQSGEVEEFTLEALIDENTGKVNSNGYDFKGKEIMNHPISNFKFKDFEIPEWKQLLDVVKDMANQISELYFVSWKLCYTKEGWVLISGNPKPNPTIIQKITKHGYKDYYDKMYILMSKERKTLEENYGSDKS